MSRVSFYTRPYDRLEPYDGKLSRTVLRGGAGSNASLLPDIHSEKDILKLTTTLIANTKGDGKAGDEFWTKAETLLYCALIGYIWYEGREEEKNFQPVTGAFPQVQRKCGRGFGGTRPDCGGRARKRERPEGTSARFSRRRSRAAGDFRPRRTAASHLPDLRRENWQNA